MAQSVSNQRNVLFNCGTRANFLRKALKIRESFFLTAKLGLAAGGIKGGIKGGTMYGATDKYGYKAVENPLMLHDLHATMLQLLGMNRTKLTFRYSGRDIRPTDVHGQIIHDILSCGAKPGSAPRRRASERHRPLVQSSALIRYRQDAHLPGFLN